MVFRLSNEELEADWLKSAASRGLTDLKGHRSVGGLRISIYNGVEDEDVEELAAFMIDFQKQNQ